VTLSLRVLCAVIGVILAVVVLLNDPGRVDVLEAVALVVVSVGLVAP